MSPDELARHLSASAVLDDVRLVVLHGSRARGDASDCSDWDVGFLAGPAADVGAIGAFVTSAVGSDRVDLVDLASASALLRFRAARDGIALFERRSGELGRFQLEATLFWCDVEPVLRAAHHDLLAALG